MREFVKMSPEEVRQHDFDRIVAGLVRCRFLARDCVTLERNYAVRVACSGVLRRALKTFDEITEHELGECASVIGGWL